MVNCQVERMDTSEQEQWHEEDLNRQPLEGNSGVCTSECPECGGPLWNKYDNYRSIRTLQGVVRFWLKVQRCQKIVKSSVVLIDRNKKVVGTAAV